MTMRDEQDAFIAPRESMVRRFLPYALGLFLLSVLGWFVWQGVTGNIAVKIDDTPPTQMVDMLPPPPPTPPPPPPEEQPPEPVDTPNPTPEPSAPTPEEQAPAAMKIDGPAQAGSDAFGLQSGAGGGMGAPGSTGTCVGPNCGRPGGAFSDGFYRRALSSDLQERIQGNDRLNRQVFTAEVLITVSPAGRVTAVELVRSSGRAERDETLVAALRAVEGLDPPPPGVRFPQRVTVRGRRSV